MKKQSGIIVDGTRVSLTDLLVYSRAGSIWRGDIVKDKSSVCVCFVLEYDSDKASKWILFDTLATAKEFMEQKEMDNNNVKKL